MLNVIPSFTVFQEKTEYLMVVFNSEDCHRNEWRLFDIYTTRLRVLPTPQIYTFKTRQIDMFQNRNR